MGGLTGCCATGGHKSVHELVATLRGLLDLSTDRFLPENATAHGLSLCKHNGHCTAYTVQVGWF